MLAYVLALVVGLGSFALYMAAFFFPEVHRKHDFIWSGIGLFYALVLWVCAGRMTGGVLLGQAASVALLGWLGWQTFILRRQVIPSEQQTALPTPEELRGVLSNLTSPETLSKVSGQAAKQLEALKGRVGELAGGGLAKPKAAVTPEARDEPYVPLTPEDFAPALQKRVETVIDSIPDVGSSEVLETETIEDGAEDAAIDTAANIVDAGEDLWESVSDSTVSDSAVPVTGRTAKSPISNQDTIAAVKAKAIAIGAIITDLAKGLFKQKESKPTYVRKQFRPPAEEVAPSPETPSPEIPSSETPSPEIPSPEASSIKDAPPTETVTLQNESPAPASADLSVNEQVIEAIDLPVDELFVEETDLLEDALLEDALLEDALLEDALLEDALLKETALLEEEADLLAGADLLDGEQAVEAALEDTLEDETLEFSSLGETSDNPEEIFGEAEISHGIDLFAPEPEAIVSEAATGTDEGLSTFPDNQPTLDFNLDEASVEETIVEQSLDEFAMVEEHPASIDFNLDEVLAESSSSNAPPAEDLNTDLFEDLSGDLSLNPFDNELVPELDFDLQGALGVEAPVGEIDHLLPVVEPEVVAEETSEQVVEENPISLTEIPAVPPEQEVPVAPEGVATEHEVPVEAIANLNQVPEDPPASENYIDLNNLDLSSLGLFEAAVEEASLDMDAMLKGIPEDSVNLTFDMFGETPKHKPVPPPPPPPTQPDPQETKE